MYSSSAKNKANIIKIGNPYKIYVRSFMQEQFQLSRSICYKVMSVWNWFTKMNFSILFPFAPPLLLALKFYWYNIGPLWLHFRPLWLVLGYIWLALKHIYFSLKFMWLALRSLQPAIKPLCWYSGLPPNSSSPQTPLAGSLTPMTKPSDPQAGFQISIALSILGSCRHS